MVPGMFKGLRFLSIGKEKNSRHKQVLVMSRRELWDSVLYSRGSYTYLARTIPAFYVTLNRADPCPELQFAGTEVWKSDTLTIKHTTQGTVGKNLTEGPRYSTAGRALACIRPTWI